MRPEEQDKRDRELGHRVEKLPRNEQFVDGVLKLYQDIYRVILPLGDRVVRFLYADEPVVLADADFAGPLT